MKAFIETNFKMIDIDNDGIIGENEYRFNCITRVAVDSIQVVDDAFTKLLDVSTLIYFFLHYRFGCCGGCFHITISRFGHRFFFFQTRERKNNTQIFV